MEKKIIRSELGELDWESMSPLQIDEAIEQLQSLKAEGATHIDVNARNRYSESVVEIDVYLERLETDAEFALRLEQEKNEAGIQTARLKRNELAQLARLKLKYGDHDINGLMDELGVIKI